MTCAKNRVTLYHWSICHEKIHLQYPAIHAAMSWTMAMPLMTISQPAFTGNFVVRLHSASHRGTSPVTQKTFLQMKPRYVPPHRQRRSSPRPTASTDPPPGLRRPQQLTVGDELEGQVSSIADFGAFVDLGEYGIALVHISEIVNSFVKNVADHLAVGDTVRVRVIDVKQGGRRISLSMKQSDAVRATGYDRVVELGGDWGHPWNDDDSAQFADLGPRPKGQNAWEHDPDLFEPWVDPDKEE